MSKQMKLTCAALSKGDLCFIENISKKTKYSGGKKFSRSSIIRTLVEVSRKVNVDVSNVKSEKELESKFKEAFKCYRKTGDQKQISNGKEK